MVINSKVRRRVSIVELCEAHVDCVNRTAPVVDFQTPYKMIRTTNVRDGFIDTENVRYVTEPTYKKWTRRLIPKRGDVILTREAPLGEVGKIRTDDQIFLGQRLYQFRTNPQKLDADFLLYSLLDDDLQGQIRGYGSGATVEHMRLQDIPSLEISLPPIEGQRKIAAILSAYDDLIDNNLRRIKILEEMAQNLYREWFTYPFRGTGLPSPKPSPSGRGASGEGSPWRLVDSLLGPIPEGWEVKKLSEMVETQYGYTESASEVEVGPKFVRGMDINKRSYIQWDTVPYCRMRASDHPRYKLELGDIVVIRMADPGKVGIIEKDIDGVFASYLIRIRPTSPRLSPYYLFYFLLSDRYQDYVKGASTGTTRKSVSAGVIVDIDMVVPPDNIREQFEDQVPTIRQMLSSLLDKNANLRRTRDLLLPRLISGEVDVSELNIAVPEEVAV